MDVRTLPDIRHLTIEEAKQFIMTAAATPGDSHDVVLDNLARLLLEAAVTREEAEAMLRGDRSRHLYSSLGQHPLASATAVLYDAAWELVREGLLRPGIRHFGVLNERPSGFCKISKRQVADSTSE